MHSRRVVFALVGSFAACAVAACATGASPVGGGGSSGNNGDGDSGGGSVYTTGDGGGVSDGGLRPLPPNDSGTTTPIDSGSSTPVDSGTGTGGGTFCTGQTSSQENDYGNNKYDDWCFENADFDSTGSDFACESSSDCGGLFTVPSCCYKPKSGGDCEYLYGSQPQCVVQ